MLTPPPLPIGWQDENARQTEIRRVIGDCFRRRLAGEMVSDAEVIAQHATLMPDLQTELHKYRHLEAAWQVVEADGAEPPDNSQSSLLSLHVRCPNCHTPTAVVPDSSLASILCSACGSPFHLLGTDDVSTPLDTPRRIGRFELLEQVGVGGFGAVWKALDPELARFVAIKIPCRGQLTTAETDLFFREARTTAQLRHPNIVHVHEVGRDGDRVYIVSDLIDGVSLAEQSETVRMSLREAAIFCRKVALALGHAHAAGIIHRDLKPSNILVDAAGEPHITDFGLASRRGQETTVTLDGQILGTPAYMSPEQARGEAHTSDHASDIFSLGVVLYELLTGELPFRGSVRLMLEQILSQDPVSPRSLNRLVPRDLETIVLKCLEKEPRRRYFSARDLADDLQRFLDGDSIVAKPVARWEQVWRWCRRRRAQAVAIGLLLFVAVSAPLVALNQRAVRQAAQQQAESARWQHYLSDMHVAMKAWEHGDSPRVLEILERHRPAPHQLDLRRFEWYYLQHQTAAYSDVPTYSHMDAVSALAVTSDGSRLVVGLRSSRSDETIHIWDVARGVKLRSLTGQIWPKAIAISPDDRQMATVGVETDLSIWDLSNGKLIRELAGHTGYIYGVAYSPDGRFVASGSLDHTVRLWNAATGEEIHAFVDESCEFGFALAFSPDGNTLAAGDVDGKVFLWDVHSFDLVHEMTGALGAVSSLAFSSDGRSLVTGANDRIVRVWDPVNGTLQKAFLGHASPIRVIALAPDDTSVATASTSDAIIHVWDIASATETHTLKGHSGGVKRLAFSRQGTLYSGGDDGDVKAWHLNRKYDVNVLRGDTGQTWSVAISPDGTTVAAGGGDGVARVWDLASGALLKSHSPENMPWINAVALSPDGHWLALGGDDKSGSMELWNVDTDELVRLRHGGSQINSLAWSADGQVLVSGDSGDNDVILWDPVTGKERLRLAGHERWISWVAISPDDRTLVTRCDDNTLQVWDLPVGRLRKTIQIPAYFRTPAVFSADGKLLACVDGEHVIQFRETVDWQIVVQTPPGHTDHVKHVAFSPDGLTLASASDDGTIRLWEVATGEERCVLLGHVGEVEQVQFTPDGQTLVSSGQDGTVRVWRAGAVGE